MIEVSDKVEAYLQSIYGPEGAGKYLEFIRTEPSQYIRVNRLKTSPDDLSALLLAKYNISTIKVSGIEDALKVSGDGGVLGKALEHILGYYYIQGLSSMIPPLILNPSEDDDVLDLCSAPGSKTTGISELMNNKGTLIANEIALDRVKMLVYNIDRMNMMNAGVLHFKGEQLSKIYSERFDKILVDAPCSGLGIIQKKGEVNNWWSLERAAKLGDLQLRLLIAAVKMARIGGTIVYSTCTLTVEENELILNKILEKYPVELETFQLPVPGMNAFTEYEGVTLNPEISKAQRILPWEADSDGFFIAKLRKTGSTSSPERTPVKAAGFKILRTGSKELEKYLSGIKSIFGIEDSALSGYKFILKASDIYFVDGNWEDDNLSAFERIGTRFGIIDKNGEVTLHTQAAETLAPDITRNIYTIEEKEDLRTYLDGGIIKKTPQISGQCVIQYNNMIIGTAVVTPGGIKSRFPRSKRTQEIIF